MTNRLVIDFTWDLPWRQSSKLFGGWTVSGIFVAESGQPYTIFSGPLGGELTQRTNVRASPTTGNPKCVIRQTSSISLPSLTCAALARQVVLCAGTDAFWRDGGFALLGSSGRNEFMVWLMSTSTPQSRKTFRLSERFNLVFRAEFYNLFNRANYYNPISDYSLNGVTTNPQFGEIRRPTGRVESSSLRLNW